MKVHGIEMPEDRLTDALLSIPGPFKACDVEAVFARELADVDFGIQHRGSTIMRAADRLIQKARKSGSLVHSNGRWKVAQGTSAREG